MTHPNAQCRSKVMTTGTMDNKLSHSVVVLRICIIVTRDIVIPLISWIAIYLCVLQCNTLNHLVISNPTKMSHRVSNTISRFKLIWPYILCSVLY